MIHRVWFKIIFNPILRILQFWNSRPYVIVSKMRREKCIGYGFRRIKKL